MATRASSKKDPSPKAAPKADPPAAKTAPPAPATDLISTTRKKTPTETRKTPRSGVPPISKANQPSPAPPPPAAASTVAPAAPQPPAAPPPRPETISLIDDHRSKRSEEPSSEPKQKSVLPPISKIRSPVLTKPPVPPVQVVRPEPVPVVAAEQPAPPGAASDDKVIHIKPPIIVRELAQQ